MLIFTGDINLTDWYFNVGFGIGSRIADGYNPFANFERRKEEFWIGNFEGVASDVSCNKGFAGEVFRVSQKHYAGYRILMLMVLLIITPCNMVLRHISIHLMR